MSKEELLNILLSNIDCFNNVNEMDFYLLATIDTNELGFMNNNAARVSPLLKQIANYALADIILTDDQIESMECYFGENDSILKESILFLDVCYEYIMTLIDEDCKHPSVLIFDTLDKGFTIYNEFNEILNDIIELADDNLQDDLIELAYITDEKIFDIIDNKFDYLLIKLKDGFITNKKELVLSITNFSKSILNIIMTISNNKGSYNIDDSYIYIFGNEKIISKPNIYNLDFINAFISIIEKTDEYKVENYDEDIDLLMDDLKEAYFIYKSYKYLYIKHDYREQKLLEKSKKM